MILKTLIAASILAVATASAQAQTMPEFITKAHKIEAKALMMAKGTVIRRGHNLTIRYDGVPVARFKDMRPRECEGNETCSVWIFVRMIRVYDQSAKKYRRLAIVKRNNGELETHMLVYSDGSLLFTGANPLVSPRGDWLASGNNEDALIEPYFEIIDLKAKVGNGIYSSSMPCEPKRFKGETDIELNCKTIEGHEFTSRIVRQNKVWRLLMSSPEQDLKPPIEIETIKTVRYYLLKNEPEIGYYKIIKRN